jgi:hypothetical protein
MAALQKAEAILNNQMQKVIDNQITLQQFRDNLLLVHKQLYREGTREEYAHIKTHLAAAVIDGDIDQARADKINNVLTRGETNNAHVPTEIFND